MKDGYHQNYSWKSQEVAVSKTETLSMNPALSSGWVDQYSCGGRGRRCLWFRTIMHEKYITINIRIWVNITRKFTYGTRRNWGWLKEQIPSTSYIPCTRSSIVLLVHSIYNSLWDKHALSENTEIAGLIALFKWLSFAFLLSFVFLFPPLPSLPSPTNSQQLALFSITLSLWGGIETLSFFF